MAVSWGYSNLSEWKATISTNLKKMEAPISTNFKMKEVITPLSGYSGRNKIKLACFVNFCSLFAIKMHFYFSKKLNTSSKMNFSPTLIKKTVLKHNWLIYGILSIFNVKLLKFGQINWSLLHFEIRTDGRSPPKFLKSSENSERLEPSIRRD